MKSGLFIYECVRTIIIAFALANLLPEISSIPWLAFTAPGALFPLMALFILIDDSRYKVYLPLYIAGRCIGIISLLGWSIVSKLLTMTTGFYGGAIIVELFFFSGDFFAMAVVLFLFKRMHKLTKKPVLAAVDIPDTEEKQCE